MDTLTQQIIFLIIEIHSFWGDLSGISAKTATLSHTGPVSVEGHASDFCMISDSAGFWREVTIPLFGSTNIVLQRFVIAQALFTGPGGTGSTKTACHSKGSSQRRLL